MALRQAGIAQANVTIGSRLLQLGDHLGARLLWSYLTCWVAMGLSSRSVRSLSPLATMSPCAEGFGQICTDLAPDLRVLSARDAMEGRQYRHGQYGERVLHA
jgi:hypothetical protein